MNTHAHSKVVESRRSTPFGGPAVQQATFRCLSTGGTLPESRQHALSSAQDPPYYSQQPLEQHHQYLSSAAGAPTSQAAPDPSGLLAHYSSEPLSHRMDPTTGQSQPALNTLHPSHSLGAVDGYEPAGPPLLPPGAARESGSHPAATSLRPLPGSAPITYGARHHPSMPMPVPGHHPHAPPMGYRGVYPHAHPHYHRHPGHPGHPGPPYPHAGRMYPYPHPMMGRRPVMHPGYGMPYPAYGMPPGSGGAATAEDQQQQAQPEDEEMADTAAQRAPTAPPPPHQQQQQQQQQAGAGGAGGYPRTSEGGATSAVSGGGARPVPHPMYGMPYPMPYRRTYGSYPPPDGAPPDMPPGAYTHPAGHQRRTAMPYPTVPLAPPVYGRWTSGGGLPASGSVPPPAASPAAYSQGGAPPTPTAISTPHTPSLAGMHDPSSDPQQQQQQQQQQLPPNPFAKPLPHLMPHQGMAPGDSELPPTPNAPPGAHPRYSTPSPLKHQPYAPHPHAHYPPTWHAPDYPPSSSTAPHLRRAMSAEVGHHPQRNPHYPHPGPGNPSLAPHDPTQPPHMLTPATYTGNPPSSLHTFPSTTPLPSAPSAPIPSHHYPNPHPTPARHRSASNHPAYGIPDGGVVDETSGAVHVPQPPPAACSNSASGGGAGTFQSFLAAPNVELGLPELLARIDSPTAQDMHDLGLLGELSDDAGLHDMSPVPLLGPPGSGGGGGGPAAAVGGGGPQHTNVPYHQHQQHHMQQHRIQPFGVNTHGRYPDPDLLPQAGADGSMFHATEYDGFMASAFGAIPDMLSPGPLAAATGSPTTPETAAAGAANAKRLLVPGVAAAGGPVPYPYPSDGPSHVGRPPAASSGSEASPPQRPGAAAAIGGGGGGGLEAASTTVLSLTPERRPQPFVVKHEPVESCSPGSRAARARMMAQGLLGGDGATRQRQRQRQQTVTVTTGPEPAVADVRRRRTGGGVNGDEEAGRDGSSRGSSRGGSGAAEAPAATTAGGMMSGHAADATGAAGGLVAPSSGEVYRQQQQQQQQPARAWGSMSGVPADVGALGSPRAAPAAANTHAAGPLRNSASSLRSATSLGVPQLTSNMPLTALPGLPMLKREDGVLNRSSADGSADGGGGGGSFGHSYGTQGAPLPPLVAAAADEELADQEYEPGGGGDDDSDDDVGDTGGGGGGRRPRRKVAARRNGGRPGGGAGSVAAAAGAATATASKGSEDAGARPSLEDMLANVDALTDLELLGDLEPQAMSALLEKVQRKGKGGRAPAEDPRLDPNIDPRKARRILANRISAARSKLKQKLLLEGLKARYDQLVSSKEQYSRELSELKRACRELEMRNKGLAGKLQSISQATEL